MNKRKVIIDTDPGIDDLLAIAVALESEELDVLAISTVFGNVPLHHTSKNAQLIADVFEKDVQIIEGSDAPLFYDRKNSAKVHGEDGLGGLHDKYSSQTPSLTNLDQGVSKLYEILKHSKEKITIIALGPLTNIAKLLLIDETIHEKIEEIHIMGGGIEKGNTNELVEFNFYSDSYAAQVVLSSKLPIYLSTLDVTAKVYFSDDEFELLENESLKQKMIKESIAYYIARDRYLHDVVSVLTVIKPELFTFKEVAMRVVCGTNEADGMSYVLRDQSLNKNIRLVDTNHRTEIIRSITNTVNKIQ